MGLIIPKNNADAKTLDATLKVYYDAKGWLSNEDLIDKLSELLQQEGIETERKEPQSYTKKTQVPAYFGFIEWEDPSKSQSRRRLTESGIEFYEARTSKNNDEVMKILIQAIKSTTFGRNAVGCSSDSDIEAPNVFIKASMLLGKLKNEEFAYILDLMENHQTEFGDAVNILKIKQLKNIPLNLSGNAMKWCDPKPITALKNWGLLDAEGALNPTVIERYHETLMELRTKNTEGIKAAADYDNPLKPARTAPYQRILYGPPGTGKSYKIKNEYLKGVPEGDIFRVTFHPDYDYACFVGSYKPIMENGKIVYDYEAQAFTLAYIEAKKNPDKQVYLVIEEINRGNCSQIFGDLFQLLDRKDGISEYPIKGDAALMKHLKNEKIAEKKLSLPGNFNIIATMNTSDQSLFPIDSAFKRRWDMEYMPITLNESKKSHNFTIAIGKHHYRWHSFLAAVNKRIFMLTDSEDKQVGNFFIKDSISEETFRDKIMFYLWSEICKEEAHSKKTFFKWTNGQEEKEFGFSELYDDSSTEILLGFMSYLGVEAV